MKMIFKDKLFEIPLFVFSLSFPFWHMFRWPLSLYWMGTIYASSLLFINLWNKLVPSVYQFLSPLKNRNTCWLLCYSVWFRLCFGICISLLDFHCISLFDCVVSVCSAFVCECFTSFAGVFLSCSALSSLCHLKCVGFIGICSSSVVADCDQIILALTSAVLPLFNSSILRYMETWWTSPPCTFKLLYTNEKNITIIIFSFYQ